MGTTLDDIAYNMYIEDAAEEEIRHETIEKFREDILRRYYLKKPGVLKTAHRINNNAIDLYNQHYYSASMIFSFSAIELLIKEVVTRPLLHGNVIDESVADYITEEILKKMKNYSQYSKLFTNFVKSYTKNDLKNYKGNDLIKSFDDLQKKRNDILHKGIVVNKDTAFHANQISRLYYEVIVDTMNSLGLKVNKKTWKIEKK